MTQTMTITVATVEHCQATPWDKQANRRWEAEWFTDQESGEGIDFGHRVITLSASHRNGVYEVTAGIATAIDNEGFKVGFKVRQFKIFHDPLIRFSAERARFSQKRLREIFDNAYQSFDPVGFYAANEVEH